MVNNVITFGNLIEVRKCKTLFNNKISILKYDFYFRYLLLLYIVFKIYPYDWKKIFTFDNTKLNKHTLFITRSVL